MDHKCVSIRAIHTTIELYSIRFSNIQRGKVSQKRVLQRVLRYYHSSTVRKCALCIEGLKLRKHYNESLKQNPNKWKTLRAPASMQSAQRTLSEMFLRIPDVDRTQFQELGDGSILMPPAMMEKYLYPALCLMQYLLDKADKNLPTGGIDMMIVYSFFCQKSTLVYLNLSFQLTVLW